MCFLPSETGDCRASFVKFHYDRTDGVCKSFTYGGCNGNRNNFDTIEQCLQYCGTAQGTGRCPLFKLSKFNHLTFQTFVRYLPLSDLVAANTFNIITMREMIVVYPSISVAVAATTIDSKIRHRVNRDVGKHLYQVRR